MSGDLGDAERAVWIEYLPNLSARASISETSHEFYRVYYADGSIKIECLSCDQLMRDRWT